MDKDTLLKIRERLEKEKYTGKFHGKREIETIAQLSLLNQIELLLLPFESKTIAPLNAKEPSQLYQNGYSVGHTNALKNVLEIVDQFYEKWHREELSEYIINELKEKISELDNQRKTEATNGNTNKNN